MTLILRALAHPGEECGSKIPVFLIRPVVAQERIELKPVAVDADGLDVSAGIRDYPQARFVLLTPAHQSPLGVALSLDRRHQLLEWATRAQAWVIEDDYDSEFRYHGSRCRR
jgi:GntR family transcriptional regulator/MocR family aminotransferase